MDEIERCGVVFPEGETGSTLLLRLLRETAARWPGVLDEASLADGRAFRSAYGERLTRFESARLASGERLAIGRFLVERAAEAFGHAAEGSEVSLATALARPGDPAAVECVLLSGKGRLAPRVSYHGRLHEGSAIRELGERLVADERATGPVAAALRWLVENALDAAGEIDLQGRRFATVGAAAEIAPTQLLLEAGADVLWIDTVAPPATLVKDSTLSGRLFVPREPTDLLRDPRRIAATMRAFAEGGPLDVGLYAYAPGRGREWRLAAAMNAIVDAMPAGSVRSVALMVSPTTPVPPGADMLAAANRRYAARPRWQRSVEALGLLGEAHVGPEGDRLLRNVVSVQGAGYQAAQYLGKTLAVERWATVGPTGQGAPVSVSANVAAITMTRSLRHPVFEAGFAGASAFGVEAFEPEETRALNGLLLIHDLLNPNAPGATPGDGAGPAERARRLLSQQVHGGLFAMPYALEPAIRVAAVIGLAKRPGLLPGFVRAVLGG